MRKHVVNIEYRFPQPVDKIFSWFKRHENLELIFVPFEVRHVKDGMTERYDVGSVRKLQRWPLPAVEETVLSFMENRFIGYAITSGGAPIFEHKGAISFFPDGEETKIRYEVEFRCRILLVGAILRSNIKRNLLKGFNELRLLRL